MIPALALTLVALFACLACYLNGARSMRQQCERVAEAAVIEAYQEGYVAGHRKGSIAFANATLPLIERLGGREGLRDFFIVIRDIKVEATGEMDGTKGRAN